MVSESELNMYRSLSGAAIPLGVILFVAAFFLPRGTAGAVMFWGIVIGLAGVVGFLLLNKAQPTVAPVVDSKTGQTSYPLGTKQNPRVMDDGTLEWTDWTGNTYRKKPQK